MIIWGKRVPTQPFMFYDPHLKTKCISILLLGKQIILDKSNGNLQCQKLSFRSFFLSFFLSFVRSSFFLALFLAFFLSFF